MPLSYCDTPIGTLGIVTEGEALVRLLWPGELPALKEEVDLTALDREVVKQLQAYFKRSLKVFDLPLRATGTPFQEKVWAALQRIPYGSRVSYQQIATEIGNPKACRAVGLANSRNPIPIIIPCHRVVGKDGSLTGFGGGLGVKEQL
ncbi:MAG: methylated-DNA--[protein]-cysteine S-methyltransferase, partial [Symbiobacteriaceae bacterium]|nr:methylated-DNA--[protein]-cysteine S-methyltransferase [Symbiobacteriaceae bacterium]